MINDETRDAACLTSETTYGRYPRARPGVACFPRGDIARRNEKQDHGVSARPRVPKERRLSTLVRADDGVSRKKAAHTFDTCRMHYCAVNSTVNVMAK